MTDARTSAPRPPHVTKADRQRQQRDERQRKAAALRAEAARREVRRRTILVAAVALTVIAAAIGIFVVVQNGRRDAAATAGATPRNLEAGSSVVVGQPAAPVTLTVYEDFQCPACRNFEQLNAEQIDRWLDAGTVKVEYRPIAFLDRASTDDYSTRALNAAATVLDLAPAGFRTFHDALYAEQPAEGGPGLTDERLLRLAVAAGAPEAPAKADIDGLRFKAWTAKVTDDASKAGVSRTPTVIVDGKPLADHSPAAVAAAVTAALG